MRAGRFGAKAGRVAVVVAFVLGTLVVGTTAAGAEALSSGTNSAEILGELTQVAAAQVATAQDANWT